MSSAKKKTKAAKAPARTTAAEKKTAKKAASRPSAAKPKATKAKTAKSKATKAKTAKPKATKAATAKPKATKAAKTKSSKAVTAKAKTSKTSIAKTTKAPTTEAAAAPRAAAAAPPPAAPGLKNSPTRKRSRSRRSRTKQVHAPASEVLPQRTLVVGESRPKLGNKWECFSCGAKFYDLNKPEPLCPKCEANQLERPKAVREVKPRATPRASRAMAPLLDDDEDAMVVKKEELDLGVAGVDEAVTKFIGVDEPEEVSAEEEEEEP